MSNPNGIGTVGVHYHVPAMRKEDGTIVTTAFFGVFLESLADNCRKLKCFLYEPLAGELPMMNYVLKKNNIEVISLGPHVSIPKRYFEINTAIKIFKSHLDSLDFLIVRTPTPLIPVLQRIVNPKKLALYIVGDYTVAKDLKMPLIKKWFVKVLYYFMSKAERNAALQSLIMTNSRNIFNDFSKFAGNVYELRSTTLTANDFFVREDTAQNEVLNVVYSGRIDPFKNLHLVYEACKQLIDEGFNINIHLAYLLDPGAVTYFNSLVQLGKDLGIHDRIIYHGQMQIGEELNSIYRKSDVLVIASATEGFPRVIWEAMANSLPVIATKVGSIPYYLENEKSALLIEPNSKDEIKNALKKIFTQVDLRKQLIRNGREIVKDNTLEEFGRKMTNALIDFGKKSN